MDRMLWLMRHGLLLGLSLVLVVGCQDDEDEPVADLSTGGDEGTGGADEETGGESEETGGTEEETGGESEETGGTEEETGGDDDGGDGTGGEADGTGGEADGTGGDDEPAVAEACAEALPEFVPGTCEACACATDEQAAAVAACDEGCWELIACAATTSCDPAEGLNTYLGCVQSSEECGALISENATSLSATIVVAPVALGCYTECGLDQVAAAAAAAAAAADAAAAAEAAAAQ